MKNIIEKIQKQLEILKEKHSSDFNFIFNSGATDEDFAQLEALFKMPLPEDFKALYRVANGQSIDSQDLLQGEEWLSIERIMDEYQCWLGLYENGDFLENGKDYGCNPDEGIKSDFWFNPKWIPLTSNGADGKMIDLDPTPDGKIGQIIHMIHDAYARELIAPSLKAFFEQFANDLENDEYLIHKRCGLIRKDDWRNGEWFNSQFESKE